MASSTPIRRSDVSPAAALREGSKAMLTPSAPDKLPLAIV